MQCDTHRRVAVLSVNVGSACSDKLSPGDILLSADGVPLTSKQGLLDACKGLPGTTLKMLIQSGSSTARILELQRALVDGVAILRPQPSAGTKSPHMGSKAAQVVGSAHAKVQPIPQAKESTPEKTTTEKGFSAAPMVAMNAMDVKTNHDAGPADEARKEPVVVKVALKPASALATVPETTAVGYSLGITVCFHTHTIGNLILSRDPT